MSSSAAVFTQLAAVMESLVFAAVAELRKLVEDSDAGEEPPPPARAAAESREKTVQFASIMETLGNEALGKIMNIVDEAKLLVEPESGRSGHRPQTSVLNILNSARVELEHSYGLRLQSCDTDGSTRTPLLLTKPDKEGAEPQFVPAVTVKDEHGNIDLGAIADRARDEAVHPFALDVQQQQQNVSSSPEFVLQSVTWKYFMCTACGKSFPSKSDLKSHYLIHTGQKPFACSVCGRSFRLRRSMQSHMSVHSHERPFECPQCGKRFTKQAHAATCR